MQSAAMDKVDGVIQWVATSGAVVWTTMPETCIGPQRARPMTGLRGHSGPAWHIDYIIGELSGLQDGGSTGQK